jgi:aspartate carbamoyltransferase
MALSFEDIIREGRASQLLAGKILATLFYEASTRTRLSTESAMLRLGGSVLSVADMKRTSSVWKGESLIDTVRTVQNYADVIAIRHSERGAAEVAAQFADVPIINCGDDANEHPTQAMLDLLTIRRERGSIDDQTILLVGDHKHSRPTNSLIYAFSNYAVRLILVSPPQLVTQREVMEEAHKRGMDISETDDLRASLQEADVVYIFRIQKERFESPEEYEKVKGSYNLDRAMLEETGRKITVMHPMPRIDEMSYDIDDYPGACYFRQSFNGVLVRMALLALLLGKAAL